MSLQEPRWFRIDASAQDRNALDEYLSYEASSSTFRVSCMRRWNPCAAYDNARVCCGGDETCSDHQGNLIGSSDEHDEADHTKRCQQEKGYSFLSKSVSHERNCK